MNSPEKPRPPWWQVLVIGRNPKFTLVRIVVVAGLVWLVFGNILRPVRVSGVSMEPTYRSNAINLVNRWAYRSSEPGRGDVVAVRTTGESILYLKRVVGLPGERVAFERGTLLVNGRPFAEPYVKQRSPWNEAELELGPDEYFLVGDNRSMPARDHTHGAFRRERIVGRILW
jgi:signal peptidase I